MVGDDAQPSAFAKQVLAAVQHLLEGFHLVVHLDTQGLEQLSHLFLLPLLGKQLLRHLQQVACGGNALCLASLDNGSGKLPAVLQLSIEIEDVGQLLLTVVVHDVGSGLFPLFVHAHVERCVEAEGEPAALVVQMMARHTEVGQQTVDLLHVVVAHPVLDISKVASDEGESIIIDDIFLRIGILVEAVEVAFLPQATEDLPAVATPAECHIYINTVGLDFKPVDALPEEYWNVICRRNI